jgi:protein-disulfide isomerase
MRFLAVIIGATMLLGCQQPEARAQLSETDRSEVRDIVREYILENPEIIEEALIELQRRARDREVQTFYSAIEDNHDAVYADQRDPRTGPADAPIVIVEFMDYKCSYCRVAAEWVASARQRYSDQVQFIFKEYPILGPDSLEAARAAIAVSNQSEEAYEQFHMAMVSASGPLPGSRIDQLAALSGVNVERMRADMNDPAVMAHINDVRNLAREMGLTGTPFFIVDGVVVPGANTMGLEDALQRALIDAG